MNFVNSFLAPMTTYDIVYFCVAGLSLIGILFALIYLLSRANKIKKHFNISIGMTYEQVTAALGEPAFKNEKGGKLSCKWNLSIDGKPYKVNAVFKGGILKTLI